MNVEDLALHLRLVAGDVAAPEECVTRWLPTLVRRLSARADLAWFTSRDEHFAMEAALEALMDYVSKPAKYDPGRMSLGSYLFMAAYRDLQNAAKRDHTQGRGASSIHLVEEWLPSGNSSFEEGVISSVDAKAMWNTVLAEFTEPLDHRLLSLLLHGERATAVFVEALGIFHLPKQEQKVVVKRHKDRITRRLERLGSSKFRE